MYKWQINSQSLILKEMLIKITVKYHYVPIYYNRITKIRLRIPNVAKNVEHLYVGLKHCWWEFNDLSGTPTSEDNLAVSYEVKKNLPYNPPITLVDIYQRKTKTCVHKCLLMFREALFIISPNWKAKCPSIGEWAELVKIT